MYFDNFLRVLLVSVSYIILIFGLGSLIVRPLAIKRIASERVIMYFVAGNFYVINIIYLLLFFQCTSRVITIMALVMGGIGIRLLYDAHNVAIWISERCNKLALLARGVYGWKYFWKTSYKSIGARTATLFKRIFGKYLFDTLMIILCFGIHSYYFGYRYVTSAAFAASDEPVHLLWIQEMVTNGNLYFEDKIYPYGMHNIVYALIKVFDFKAYMVYRNLGFIMCMLLLLLLFFMVRVVYRSRYAPLVGVFLYVGADLFNYAAWDRLLFCVPMEYGSLFLYPMVIFIYRYICRKDRTDLWFFSICFALTLYIHSYDGILALLLCLSIGIAGFFRIIKGRILKRIILMGLLSGVMGILPMGIGLLTGHELQGSFYWATGVIRGTTAKTDIDSVTGADRNAGTQESLPEIDRTDSMEGTASLDRASLPQRLIRLKDKLIKALSIIYYKTRTYLIKDNNPIFINIVIAAMLLTIIRVLLQPVLKRRCEEAFLQLAVTIYMALLLILMSNASLGLPVLIEDYRVSEFAAYAFPLLLCIPLEYLYLLVKQREAPKMIVNTAIILLTAGVLITTYKEGFARVPGRYTVVNSDSAAYVFYRIVSSYEDYQWTIVSTVDEYSMVLDSGRHGDWLNLLSQLSGYNPGMKIEFPTKDIFFFVEKRPILPAEIIRVNEKILRPEISADDARVNLGDIFYSNKSDYYNHSRNMIMAKAYYWAQEYRSYFPEEMTVFYEDDDFVCYRLEQETEYLNNLAIDFPYNINP